MWWPLWMAACLAWACGAGAGAGRPAPLCASGGLCPAPLGPNASHPAAAQCPRRRGATDLCAWPLSSGSLRGTAPGASVRPALGTPGALVTPGAFAFVHPCSALVLLLGGL